MRADFPRPGEDVAQRQKGESAERSEAEGVRSPQASSPSQALTRQLSQRESHWRNHTLYASAGNFTAMPRPLPLGEVDLRSKDGEGEDTNRSAALSQKAARQMQFSVATPLVKMQCRSVRRRSGIALLKIIFPLFMRRATRSALKSFAPGRCTVRKAPRFPPPCPAQPAARRSAYCAVRRRCRRRSCWHCRSAPAWG